MSLRSYKSLASLVSVFNEITAVINLAQVDNCLDFFNDHAMIDGKCGKTADSFLVKGNENFRSGLFYDALVSYNKSLCFATEDSQQVALLYVKRSEIYLKVQLYEECLENLDLARQFELPTREMAERFKNCQNLMQLSKIKDEDDPWNFFKLSYEPHERIPYIVKCLRLDENEKYGRFIVTTSELKPGDVIAIEEPTFKFIDSEVFASRCASCLKTNNLSLIPCPSCTNSETI